MITSDRPRAAAAVIRMGGTEILLVKHRWHDGTTTWILPGGALLSGEKPEEAALRELDEETGLKGTVVREQESTKMLQDVAWFPIKDLRENPEVRQVLTCLNRHGE